MTYHTLKNVFFWMLFLGLITACGGGKSALEKKKEQLEAKKRDLAKLAADIKILEKEIAALDPKFKKTGANGTLATLVELKKSDFTHYIEVKGSIKSDKNVNISSETAGLVTRVNVVEGQGVGQGQILVQQDNNVLRQSIEEIRVQLDLATQVFERQSKLWDQKIGTELQYLQAKTNKEGLERRLQTLQAQVEMSNVKAPFAGIVDEIFIKPGQNAAPGVPLMRLVSLGSVQVVADVSESYLGKIRVGDAVQVMFPSLDIERTAYVSLIGQIINPENRTFRIEINLANGDNMLKPDLLATVKLKNYQESNAVVVPTNLIQRDKTGEFVYVAREENQKWVARKVKIERGDTYNNQTVIKNGLDGTEKLIDKGFNEVVDGSAIEITS